MLDAIVDCHCHILPGLDDGAQDHTEFLRLVASAASEGIVDCICTPHIQPGVYDNSTGTIVDALNRYREQLLQHGVPLRLHVGAELRIEPDLLTRLDKFEVPTLAGGRYVLLEPAHDVRMPNLDRFLERVRGAGYLPIIAHPERLAWSERHFSEIVEWALAGSYLQLTAGSITGAFGEGARMLSERLLTMGAVSLVASDAHNTTRRPFRLAKAYAATAALIGDEKARTLFETNPSRILADREIERARPIQAGPDNRLSRRIGQLFGWGARG